MVQSDERGPGRNPEMRATDAETSVASRSRTNAEPSALMEVVLERGNLMRAYQRVVGNKGAAGVDAMTVGDLKGHLQRHWPAIRERINAGQYQPSAVRRVRIPKPQGGERALGIPTVQDRLIQQALHQVLSPLLEPTFSASSYGFRPGRSAHQAVSAMRGYVEEGHRWVVDIDLEAFFDRVNHDVLMGLLARHVGDPRVLKLVRAYLEAGIMDGGLVSPRREGAPQGGPLSPLLSNLLLTELDWELERRGHRFCRYADDCNIYVRSKQAGERVMASVTRFLEERLKLRGEPQEKRGGSPVAPSFPGLQRDLAPSDTAASVAGECRTAPVDTARCASTGPGPFAVAYPPYTGPDPAGLGGVLPAHCVQACLGDGGWLAAPQTTRDPVAAVEAPGDESACVDETGVIGSASVSQREQWSRAVVE